LFVAVRVLGVLDAGHLPTTKNNERGNGGKQRAKCVCVCVCVCVCACVCCRDSYCWQNTAHPRMKGYPKP
jgi:hypothetical protein